MPNRVQILPEVLTNKIAAGEVIERPASVLKELIENAIDAGADRIEIRLEAGGRRLISVSDNGSGMSRDDAVLSVERYATSKIATDRDLFSGIATYGFRGEALPSIGAVSRIAVQSRTEASEEAVSLEMEGGRLIDVKSAGAPKGTRIRVQDLFYNTPVRRKFLKSVSTELSHCMEIIHRMAMANPTVGFQVSHDGRSLLEAHPGEALGTRATRIIGKEAATSMIPLERGGDNLSIRGLLGTPELTRSNRRHLYCFINGRVVRDPVFSAAVYNAYRSLIFPGRHPVAALFLEVAPEEVDVNVHPTKSQVKFQDAYGVRRFIEAAIKERLAGAPWLGEGQRDAAPSNPPTDTPQPKSPPAYEPSPNPAGDDRGDRVREAVAGFYQREASRPETPLQPPHLKSQPQQTRTAPKVPFQAKLGEEGAGYYGKLELIGQLLDSFIVCQDEEGLALLDQHAAQERLNFEIMRQRFHQSEKQIQTLLFPVEVQLDAAGVETVERNRAALEGLGLRLESFGPDLYMLKGVPRELIEEPWETILPDLLDALTRYDSTAPFEAALEELFANMACKKSITARMSLEPDHMRELLRQLDRQPFATNCPHGRPILKKITKGELYRMFKR